MNSTASTSLTQVKRGHRAALRILLPALPFEAACGALAGFWLADASVPAALGAALAHLLATLTIWLLAPKPNPEDDPATRTTIQAARHIHAVSALLVFFFPILGFLGMGYVLAVQLVSKRQGLVEIYSSEMKRAARMLGVERVEDMDSFLMEEASVEPILEILKGSDVGLKRGAVNLLGNIGGKEAVGLLKESLSDPSPEVRFYAHATLAKLDDSYTQSIKTAERQTQDEASESFAALGNAFVRYAESGLVEDVVRRQLLDRATRAFEQALDHGVGDGRLLVTLGYLHLSQGELEKAREAFARTPEGPAWVESLLGLCEIAYEKRDFTTLHTLRLELASADFKSEDPMKLVMFQFWTQTGDIA